MDIEKFKYDCINKNSEEFYEEYFISGEIWVFKDLYGDNWFEKYDDFKKYISKKLNIHYNDIGIAGSAKTGYSLNPEKFFKKFNEDSDIDIIIVSKKYFDNFWYEYLSDSYNPTARIKNINKVSFCIFRRYLNLDCFRNNEYYNNWKKKTDGFEKDIQLKFGIMNDIHYRVFESWDAVKLYYVNSINQIKENGNKGE